MVFSSLVFLCIFLPAVFVLHQVLPGIRAKNVLLVIASVLFYAYGEPVYVLLLVLSAFFNYLCALRLGKLSASGHEAAGEQADENAAVPGTAGNNLPSGGETSAGSAGHTASRGGRAVLALAVFVNIALLVIFKYVPLLVSVFNGITGMGMPVPQIRLPIGISFFTFQALSYVIDVYRGMHPAEKNFGRVLLYISFFPQLIAGPIVKYHDIAREIDERFASTEEIHRGLRRFIRGLAKKVLVANTMAAAADALFNAGAASMGAAGAWVGAFSYFFQIYYDFSGYSDMAIGMGAMFGFHFRENFLYPYASGSVREFWRRWHISLSSWFREYLYIPLGGSRKGQGRTVLNKYIVFFCTGIWHGANLTFLVWGLYHGSLMMLEELFQGGRRGKTCASGPVWKAAGHLYTVFAVLIGFVIFRADTIREGVLWIAKMFTGFHAGAAAESLVLGQLTPLYLVTLIAAAVFALPTADRLLDRIHNETLTDVLSGAGLVLSMLSLAGGTYNPFIYFRF